MSNLLFTIRHKESNPSGLRNDLGTVMKHGVTVLKMEFSLFFVISDCSKCKQNYFYNFKEIYASDGQVKKFVQIVIWETARVLVK